MELLVSGGSGFIGRRVCAELDRDGCRVHVLTRDPSRARARLPESCRIHAWDGRGGLDATGLRSIEAVVHLAGEPVAGLWTARRKRAIRDSRVAGTAALIGALGAAGLRPRLFVSASAIGYYGDRGDEELVETSPPGRGFLADVCREWEAAAARAEGLGARVVPLRFGLVLGRDGGAYRSMRRVFRLGLGGRIGSGRQYWSWIHLADAVALVRAALEGRFAGPANATAPHPVPQARFAAALAASLHRPALLPAPAALIRFAARGFAVELLASRRVLPRRALEAGFSFRFETLDAALADLARE